MIYETATFESPVGPVKAVVADGVLVGLTLAPPDARLEATLKRRFGALTPVETEDPAGVVTAIRAYFDGDVSAIDDLRVDTGGSDFQRRMWASMRQIPAGQTWSYGELAMKAGSPSAVRAAGTACGSNPVWLVVPCHRVVRSDGSIGNYGGGPDRKRWLLDHERKHAKAGGRLPI
jgi:methylated-DNA-[protein]-cysteine S-methyltransferase